MFLVLISKPALERKKNWKGLNYFGKYLHFDIFQAEGSSVAREMFANHTFVGCVNRKLGLFQAGSLEKCVVSFEICFENYKESSI